MQPPGGQAYRAQIEAIKAMMGFVEVDEATFRGILRAHEQPTIVSGPTSFFWFKRYHYLTSYDGFVFHLRSNRPRDFTDVAPTAFLVEAKRVTIPFV